ncbi:MAG: CoA-transferase [Anaerolineaceae bacterium]|nr:CoA-transferase [Anaerolineaceae bacterium]
MDYTASELMTVNAARLLRDGDVVLVGVGLPNLACNLARLTHAPNLNLIYEAGVVGSRPSRLPLSIGDPTLVSGASLVCSMYEIFTLYLQRGNIDVGFLGGAQIDRFGNINATVIGDYRHPKTRLPGSGGSMEIAGWVNRCYIITPHQKRRFPARVDFVTSAGFLDGRRQRDETGVRGGGPQAVVTNLGVLQPNEDGELVLGAIHPGVRIEEVQENTGWQLKVFANLRETQPPTREELHILRTELDPEHIYI